MYTSPFGKDSVFNNVDWEKKLIQWLVANEISEFVYSNTTTIDGIPVIIRIRGKLNNNVLDISQGTIVLSNDPTYSPFTMGSDYISTNSELSNLKDRKFFLVSKRKGKWEFCDKSMDLGFVTTLVDDLARQRRSLNDAEYRQIYNQYIRCKNNVSGNLDTKFRDFCQSINQQLAKKFYSDVDLAVYVKRVDSTGKTTSENTIKTNYKNKTNDIKLNITLYDDGRIKIDHEINKDYLAKYEDKWISEAKRRGLDISIPSMRKDVIDFLNSEEAELSFSKTFLQDVKSWYDSNVGSYIEGIQATQKVTGNIWREGTINESLWHSNTDKEAYKEWPQYMNMHPIVGGAMDGVIGEMTEIPVICKSVYGLATDKEKRQALTKAFTSDAFAKMLEGMKQEVADLGKDEEKLGHFSGETAVSVASMLLPIGLVKNGGKLDELIKAGEEVAETIDDLDAKFQLVTDLLKKEKRTRVDEKKLKGLIDEVGAERFKEAAPELLDQYNNAKKKGKKYTWEEVQQFFKRGNDYNAKVRDLKPSKYDFHEVTVEQMIDGKKVKFRADSYTPGISIVSRKATDFDVIQVSTFENYLKELARKYPPGTKITAPKYDAKEIGEKLEGKLILEVPLSNKSSARLPEFQKVLADYNAKPKNKDLQIELAFEPE